jgi:hypothetical protein
VKDIVFQSNPSDWLEANLVKKIIVASESITYENEPWGRQNMQTYFPRFYEAFKGCTIYNAGIVAGHANYMRDFVLHQYITAKPAVEQASLNILIHTHPFRDVIQTEDMWTGWACNMGTTMDPSKMEQFKPHLLEPEPIFEEGLVKTFSKIPFVVVHQYDRNPIIKGFMEAKFA